MISILAKFSLVPVFVTVLTTASWVLAAVEINLETTLKTGGIPVDVVVSQDGDMTFVLTDNFSLFVDKKTRIKGFLPNSIFNKLLIAFISNKTEILTFLFSSSI